MRMTDAIDKLPQRRRRISWRILIVMALAGGLWLVHAFILQYFGRLLVIEETSGHYQYVAVLGTHCYADGDRCFYVADMHYHQKPVRGILLVESRPDRLVEIGIVPEFAKFSRGLFQKWGTPLDAISAIRTDGCDDWATARAIQAWLIDRPDASVLLLCTGFRSAHLRHALNTVLDPAQAKRVGVRGLPNLQFDESNWWMSRTGVKAFGIEWLRLLHGWFAGGNHHPAPYHGPDAYQRNVRRTLLGASQ
jgi:hypothetical protein